ncbi:unnamed protein product, partial [Bubo scandiacus]
PWGFVFHSLCGGGAAAAWSRTPAGTKPPHVETMAGLSAGSPSCCSHYARSQKINY